MRIAWRGRAARRFIGHWPAVIATPASEVTIFSSCSQSIARAWFEADHIWNLCDVSHGERLSPDERATHDHPAVRHAEYPWSLPIPRRRPPGHLGDHRDPGPRLDLLRAVRAALRQRHAEGRRLPLLLLLPADLHAGAGRGDVDRHHAAAQIAPRIARARRRGPGGRQRR